VVYHSPCARELGGCATLGCARRGEVPPPLPSPSGQADDDRLVVHPRLVEPPPRRSRASRYASRAGGLGLLVGGTLGFLSGGIATVSVGFNLAGALLYTLVGGGGFAAYLAFIGGFSGYLGIREEPVPFADLLVFLVAAGAFIFGLWLPVAMGAGGGLGIASGLVATAICLPLALSAFGYQEGQG